MMKKNRLTIYFLGVVFIGPLVLAQLLYQFRDHVHFKTVETGSLLTPPIHTETLSLYEPQFIGKWQLVVIEPPTCDLACQSFSKQLNQIHIALGKDRDRVVKRILASNVIPKPFVASSLLIIDPKGWLLMQYSHTAAPKGILNDIRRLLRYSHVG